MTKTIINIDLKNATLDEALATIQRITPFKFNFKTADIAQVNGIWYKKQRVPVSNILTDLLANTSLQYEQVGNYILVTTIKKPLIHRVTIINQESSRNNIEEATTGCALLQSVTVASVTTKKSIRKVTTGHHRLSINSIKNMAMAGGEPDVLKSLQLLPGIQTSAEGTTNLSVRGGSYDQNLMLLDEAAVYNPTHTLGFFSAFNTDALKDVSIYKGIFPAQYGGRLSSVVDIRMKEGNSVAQKVTGGIGLLASRLTWEGPVKKERSSFLLSGRYSNIGLLLNLSHISNLIKISSKDSKVAFYDLNARFTTQLGNKDRLSISAYLGHDKFFMHLIDKTNLMKWGNITFSTQWNHAFNNRLFVNTSLHYSRYNYSNASFRESRDFTWHGHIQEMTAKTYFDWMINSNNHLQAGVGIAVQDVLPGKVVPNNDSAASKKVSLNNRRSARLFVYVSNEQKISSRIHISYGIRATGFAALGDAVVYRYNEGMSAPIDSTYYPKGKIVQSYFAAEPRITSSMLLGNNTSVKISYGRNYQFQHLLTNSSVGLPTDMWISADSYFKPQYANQFATGVYKTFRNDLYEASIEGYYRKSYNIIDFKDNADVFMNAHMETQVLTGEGKGYGIELLAKKNKGQSTGWISYTWSKSFRRINGINNNEWYPPTYDHRHNLSLVYNRPVTKRLHIAASWVYRSGGRTTIPVGTYIYNGVRFFYYGKRNGYTLPANHRLDISLTWHEKFKKKRKWQGEWNISVYNAYNRKNIFALYISEIVANDAKAYQVYLTGILPTITYNFTF
ncbi:TonB-dependent receptor plug domain-containing protein [Niastella caeni]|uniref:TonB-dependent receptor plug domain-containing protein n=1 Tax=Niastella caeni TaxID=2569763 RepID=UPI00140D8612|nr:TonB-dependent receptor plug domain-containing protein [Niastella caeni]